MLVSWLPVSSRRLLALQVLFHVVLTFSQCCSAPEALLFQCAVAKFDSSFIQMAYDHSDS